MSGPVSFAPAAVAFLRLESEMGFYLLAHTARILAGKFLTI